MSHSQETRRESYGETNKKVVSVSHEIYNVLLFDGPLTAWEVASLMDRAVYTVRPRLTEMCKAGRIKEVGKRWYQLTQRNETVYEVVDKQLGLMNP